MNSVDKWSFSKQFLERYQVLEELGAGGMGTVYRALERELGREVAVKVTRSRDPLGRKRFLREGELQARLRHPNVLQVLQSGEMDEQLYLVFEVVNGESLAARLERDGPLDPSEAARIVAQAAHAVAYLHENGILHRDLKADNILMTDDGTVKVCDFGLAVLGSEDEKLTEEGLVLGTLHYMAPEVLRGLPHSEASDVYSLGCVLYACLTAMLPVGAVAAAAGGDPDDPATLLQFTQTVPPPSLLRAGLPPELDSIALRSLSADPSTRVARARELAVSLEDAAVRAAVYGEFQSVMQSTATQQLELRRSLRGRKDGATRAVMPPSSKAARPGTWRAAGPFALAFLALAAAALALLPRTSPPATLPPPLARPSPAPPQPHPLPRLRLYAGHSTIRVDWLGDAPPAMAVRFGKGGSLDSERAVRHPPPLELTGLLSGESYSVRAVVGSSQAGPVQSIRTLLRVGAFQDLAPGHARSGSHDWLAVGGRLLFFNASAKDGTVTEQVSPDAGTTWSPATALEDRYTESAVHAARDGDRVWLARAYENELGTKRLRLLASPDLGESWKQVHEVSVDRGLEWEGLLPFDGGVDLLQGSGRELHILRYEDRNRTFREWAVVRELDMQARVAAARTPRGGLFLLGTSASKPPFLVGVTLEPDGTLQGPARPMPPGNGVAANPLLAASNRWLHAVWLDCTATGTSRKVLHARSPDWGATWENPRLLEGSETLADCVNLGAERLALFAGADIVAVAWHSEPSVIGSRIDLQLSADQGTTFRRAATLQMLPIGLVRGAELLPAAGGLAFCYFLASTEVFRIARFEQVLPAGFQSFPRDTTALIR
ncbi:MAG: serine/threonine protein kinase [Candidatus Wallbacteria bacterium]|nr:serine/threonine protein kinase [Candidatus Wallbacteria bacterium]